MARTLGDDFDDDLGGGGLDLEKGSSVGTGASSSYDGGGLDFDDDEAPASGSLELDLPRGQPHVSAPPPQAPSRAPGSDPGLVPDLAMPPAPVSSRPNVSVRPSGSMAAPRTSGHAPAMPPAPTSSHPRSLGPAPIPSAPPSSRGSVVPAGASAQPPPPSRPDPAAVVAKYPSPPDKMWQTPRYALRVLWRQLELRSDLESLRRRRSPDVALYEAALRAYEPKTFRVGMAITCAGLALATILFFMPVILRFARAD
ncbi:MAG: hypothetical protein KF819_22925 [Labilithrix sp.]|nr:hypothetical protein [Labilithrix sp.]